MSTAHLTRLDARAIPVRPNEVRCFATVRNEAVRLPHFLDYHRSLGVDRFFIVDNASQDGSAEYLLSQSDVHAFHTNESYAASRCGVTWLNELLESHGVGNWTLTLDADELLVYPLSETVDVHRLTSFLDHVRADGLVTFLLDMYSRAPIRETSYSPGSSFLAACPYFDNDSYHQKDASGIPVRGGPRHRLFWQGHDRSKPSPVLKKVPLIRWRAGLAYEASTHLIAGVRLPRTVTGVLLHFKFFADLYTNAEKETERKEHWDSAAQYAAYWDVLKENPGLSAFFEGSVRYESSVQLVAAGLLRMPAEYAQLVVAA